MLGLVATDSHTEIELLNIKQTIRDYKDLEMKSIQTMFTKSDSSCQVYVIYKHFNTQSNVRCTESPCLLLYR